VFGKRSSNGPEQRGPGEAPPPAPAVLDMPSKGIDVGRSPLPSAGLGAPIVSPPLAAEARGSLSMPPTPSAADAQRSEAYYEVKGTIFSALIEAIDLAQLARLDGESAREEIRDIVNEIIAIKNIVMSIA
jgi:pilus assembly protein CpaF